MKQQLIFIVIALLVTLSNLHAQNVGVGTDSPVEFFSVGASSQFRVNASGNLVRINNVQYSFPAAQATSGSVLANDGSGNLSWTKVTTGNISATGTASNTTFLRGDGAWAAPAGGGGTINTGSTAFSLTFANSHESTTVSVPGSQTGDAVAVSFTGAPTTSGTNAFSYNGVVTSNGTVTVSFTFFNGSTGPYNGTIYVATFR